MLKHNLRLVSHPFSGAHAMATITPTKQFEPNHCFLLTDVSWELYQMLGEELRDRPIRMTYDRGDLEMMTTSRSHEFFKTLLGRIIEMLCFELEIPLSSGGSMRCASAMAWHFSSP